MNVPDRAARDAGEGDTPRGDVTRGFQGVEIRFRSGASGPNVKGKPAFRCQKRRRRLSRAPQNGIIDVHPGRTGEAFDFIHVPFGIV